MRTCSPTFLTGEVRDGAIAGLFRSRTLSLPPPPFENGQISQRTKLTKSFFEIDKFEATVFNIFEYS